MPGSGVCDTGLWFHDRRMTFFPGRARSIEFRVRIGYQSLAYQGWIRLRFLGTAREGALAPSSDHCPTLKPRVGKLGAGCCSLSGALLSLRWWLIPPPYRPRPESGRSCPHPDKPRRPGFQAVGGGAS